MARWKAATALLLMGVVVLFTALAAAETQYKTLTQTDVDRVLKVFPGYVQWIKQSAPGFKVEETERNPSVWLVVGMLQKGTADYMKNKGWEFQDFALTAGSLFQAYLALESEPAAKGQAELKKEEMQKGGQTPEKQPSENVKPPLPKQSTPQESQAAMQIPPGNLELAKKNREQIRAMLATIW